MLTAALKLARSFRDRGERGQALGEYSLIMALVVIVAVSALTALGVAVFGFFGDFVGMLEGAVT